MTDVTADQVKESVLAAGITRVNHHDCGGCGAMVYYSVEGDRLFFNPSCDCTRYWSPPEPRSWGSVADWINMQDEETKPKIAALFGLSL